MINNKKGDRYRLLLELELAEECIWLQLDDKIAIKCNDCIKVFSFNESIEYLRREIEKSFFLLKEYENRDDVLSYILVNDQKCHHRYVILKEFIDLLYAQKHLGSNEAIKISEHMESSKKVLAGFGQEDTPIGSYDLCDEEGIDSFIDDEKRNKARYPGKYLSNHNSNYIGNINEYDNLRGEPELFDGRTFTDKRDGTV
jgi:hypothetical protein